MSVLFCVSVLNQPRQLICTICVIGVMLSRSEDDWLLGVRIN